MTANVSFIIAATGKCAEHPNARAAFSSAGYRRGGDQLPARRKRAGDQRRQFCRRSGGQGHRRRPCARRAPGLPHGLCACPAKGKDAKLQAVQIKTGISDGISTEVISGLDEGAQVVTGVVSTGAQAASDREPVWRRLPAECVERSDLPCRPIPSSSSRTSTRCITPAKWMSTRCAGFAGDFPGRICRHHGFERLRQKHADEHDRRARPPDRRQLSGSMALTFPRSTATRSPMSATKKSASFSKGSTCSRARPRWKMSRCRCFTTGTAFQRTNSRNAPCTRSNWSASASAPTIIPTSFPAASSSASPSPARW